MEKQFIMLQQELLQYYGFLDCHLQRQETLEGVEKLGIYFVPTGPVAEDQLHVHLQSHLAEVDMDGVLIPLPYLPRNEAGEVDEQALTLIFLEDEAFEQNWEAILPPEEEDQDVAVLNKNRRVQRLQCLEQVTNVIPQLEEEALSRRFVGTWEIDRFECRHMDGTVTYPMGKDLVGLLVYTPEGMVSSQVMQQHRPNFKNPNYSLATSQEMCSACQSYVAYYGTYDVNARSGQVTHYIDGSLFPNWIGTELILSFEFSENLLILQSSQLEFAKNVVTAKLIWRRC